MRLIETTTLEIKDILEGLQEPYAILSHRWGAEEISFQDLNSYHGTPKPSPIVDDISSREGFDKIRNCCRQARDDGFKWAWIDTCCIDKSSSAELSEAINSMFKWYNKSAVCYAFLSDVSETAENVLDHGSSFHESNWFTRGWTLQELLAPSTLRFFNSRWELLGQMTEGSELCKLVSSITRIPMAFLTGNIPLSKACVAKKMSWASRRLTTRYEDTAYCLLGIFGVNMPLLYGEGSKAFLRLQEHIIRQTHDPSILVWGKLEPFFELERGMRYTVLGALATAPAEFEDCYDFELSVLEQSNLQITDTHVKVRLGIYIKPWSSDKSIKTFILPFLRRSGREGCARVECFSWRFPGKRISIMISIDEYGFLSNERITRLSESLILCDRDIGIMSPIGILSTLLPDEAQSEHNPGISSCPCIILEIPEGYRWKVDYRSSRVSSIQEDQGGRVTNSSILRISYPNERLREVDTHTRLHAALRPTLRQVYYKLRDLVQRLVPLPMWPFEKFFDADLIMKLSQAELNELTAESMSFFVIIHRLHNQTEFSHAFDCCLLPASLACAQKYSHGYGNSFTTNNVTYSVLRDTLGFLESPRAFYMKIVAQHTSALQHSSNERKIATWSQRESAKLLFNYISPTGILGTHALIVFLVSASANQANQPLAPAFALSAINLFAAYCLFSFPHFRSFNIATGLAILVYNAIPQFFMISSLGIIPLFVLVLPIHWFYILNTAARSRKG